MFRPTRPGRGAFLRGLILGAGLALLFVWSQQGLSAFFISRHVPPKAEPDFALIRQAWQTIRESYVDRAAIKPQALTYGAVGGMVEALGDTGHSTFLTPQMLKEEEDFTSGQYKGIGAEVKMKDGQVVIVAAFEDSPAQKAGLRSGEIILRVDGQDVAGLPLLQVVRRIAGPEGTRVTLTILAPTSKLTREVTLTRATITVQNVTWHRLPGTRIAHLHLSGFSEGLTDRLRETLQDIQGAGLEGVVLDLRDNPGGLLEEAVGSTSQFLRQGNVLLEKNAKGRISPVPVKSGGLAPDLPLVVLVNQGTASAAEIMAGALQDAGRAKLVGDKTFGTGTVLEKFPLADGSALLLAVQEWLTPKGNTIWHRGIIPNISVALPDEVAPLFPEEEQGMNAEQLRTSRDRQLLKALQLLSGTPPARATAASETPPTTGDQPTNQQSGAQP